MLLLACVADQRGREATGLRSEHRAIPKKGDGNLKKALDERGAELADAGPLIAMFDHDKVRALLRPPRRKRASATCCGPSASTPSGTPNVVLLEQNMEDLVDACCAAMGQPKPAAKPKPKPQERDSILQDAAAARGDARSEILAAMPSFKRLVEAVLAARDALATET